MPRIPKNNINTPFLHIMIQGNNKNYILQDEKDKKKYLKILKEAQEEIYTIILAYCIMGNHVHLLFYEKDISKIIKFMHKTNLMYAKYYNYKYDRVGYVFRDRYKVQPIMSERYLITCINYIHNNPVKAGICKNPIEYIYSSYNSNTFLGKNEIEIRIKHYIDSRKNIEFNNDFVLMECEDKNKDEICIHKIEEFLAENNITLELIKCDKNKISKLAQYLHDKNSISYRTMEKYLNISHEKIRRIMLKYK